jgi:YD repeat-containing protein
MSAPAVTMAFDADNRVTSLNGQAVTYNADGNLTHGPVATAVATTLVGYGYDARNRLSSAGGYSYAYDPEGRRVQVSDPAGGVTRYAIDPNGALDRALVRTRTVGGQTTTTYYVYGLGLIGQEEGGAYQQYHFDARGSTVLLTDSKGAVTDTFAYGPYGEAWGRTGIRARPSNSTASTGSRPTPTGCCACGCAFTTRSYGAS